jgi:hypothetical protein
MATGSEHSPRHCDRANVIRHIDKPGKRTISWQHEKFVRINASAPGKLSPKRPHRVLVATALIKNSVHVPVNDPDIIMSYKRFSDCACVVR